MEHPSPQATKASSKRKSKAKTVPTTPEALETPMEAATNLKRRRNSGEGTAMKMCSGQPGSEDPLEGPSNAFPPKQSVPQQTLLQVPLLPPFPSFSIPPPLLPIPLLPPPQYCIPQHTPLDPLQPPQPPQPPPPPQPPQQIDEEPQPHCESPHLLPQLSKVRPHQILHVAGPHSLDRQLTPNLFRTLSLPSLSSSSSPELFPERIPAETETAAADPPIKFTRRQVKQQRRQIRISKTNIAKKQWCCAHSDEIQ